MIRVVGAVIVRDGHVLCARRGPGQSAAGLWEFPGGKVEPGESDSEALRREVREELCCEVQVGDFITSTRHRTPSGGVELTTYFCTVVAGEPAATEHECLLWLDPLRLQELDWAPADVPTMQSVVALHAAGGVS